MTNSYKFKKLFRKMVTKIVYVPSIFKEETH